MAKVKGRAKAFQDPDEELVKGIFIWYYPFLPKNRAAMMRTRKRKRTTTTTTRMLNTMIRRLPI
jgi:hypothetical protein